MPPAVLASSASAVASKPSPAPPSAAVLPAPPIDAARVASITGAKSDVAENVVKVSFPREDLPIEVEGWKKMPPFMGLTSWAAFIPGGKPRLSWRAMA
jgi:hypothetical protein